jgi:hypothetical protein
MELSKSAAVFTDAVPSAVTAAEATDTFLPTLVMSLPIVSSLLPTSPIFVSVAFVVDACASSFFSSFSVSTISR